MVLWTSNSNVGGKLSFLAIPPMPPSSMYIPHVAGRGASVDGSEGSTVATAPLLYSSAIRQRVFPCEPPRCGAAAEKNSRWRIA